MDIEVFVTPGLGDATYLIGSAGEAVVVDPQRDASRFLRAAARRGWRVVGVLETHVHNDYLSGALEIRAVTGAPIVAPARGGYGFPHRAADEGDLVEAGGLRLVARATPGHTPEHISWDVHEDGAQVPAALLTGGSLLAGSVGRTDLLGPGRLAELTALQYRTLRRLASLPDETRVLPTHGSGSFCVAGPAIGERVTTLGVERARNPLLAADDEIAFAATLLAGLGEYPRYYRHMAPLNRAGPPVLGDAPSAAPLDPSAFAAAMETGAHVVDARDRVRFAGAHLPGSWNIELDDSFAAYVGWMLPFDAPLLLVLPDPAEAAARETVTQLSRIGFDRVVGHLDGGLDAWQADGRQVASYPVLSAQEAASAQARGQTGELLDVRQPIEWRDEGIVPGARRIFVGDLPDRLEGLPRDAEITVLCKSGARAAIAASLLDRAGIPVRLVATGGADAWQRAASGSAVGR
jgi:glyoxylase-like metal-dependent hydrolase (beta-lactamase superfamily II)/rhodanese-related sulfurtransferase